eukprot:Opistho-2@94784
MGAQILHDVLHRAGLDQPAILHQLADAGIVAAILPIIADAHDATVGQVQPAAALHLKEEEFHRIGGIGQFQTPAGERARHDLAAIVERHELGAVHLAANGAAFQAVAELAEIDVDQVGRAAVNGDVVTGLAGARPADFRFIIAGDEGRAVAHLHRFEIAGEKFAGGRFGPAGGGGAGIVPVGPLGQATGVGAPHQRRAGNAEGLKREAGAFARGNEAGDIRAARDAKAGGRRLVERGVSGQIDRQGRARRGGNGTGRLPTRSATRRRARGRGTTGGRRNDATRAGGQHQRRKQRCPRLTRDHAASSVSLSFQLGSALRISRVKVQISLVPTASVSEPATTLPSLSRVTAAISASKRRATSAIRPLTEASTICAFSMRTRRLSRTWPSTSRAAIDSSKEARTSSSHSQASSSRSPRQKASSTIL